MMFGLDATGLPALARATTGKLPTRGLLHGGGTLAAFGRTRTLHAAAYRALVSSILAGQRSSGQVADACDTVCGSDDPGVAHRMSAAGTGGCHTLIVSSRSRCIFAGGRGNWSMTRPSTGIGYSVSLTAVTRRCSLPTIARHTL